MTLDYEYIVTLDRLDEVVEACLSKPFVAVDTEFARFNTYYPIVGLIQIYDGECCYLIDPVAIGDFACLSKLMRQESVTKIFHSCSEDLEVFQHYLGEIPRPVFDTQIASAILGAGFSLSYQNMVERYLSVKIPKEETRSDWLRRPLSKAQMDYAALDVIYLLQVFKQQYSSLEKSNRLAWINEECQFSANEIATQIEPKSYYHRVKNISGLDRRQLECIRRLCAWREQKARQLDIPRNRVVDEKALLVIAQLNLADKSELQEKANLSQRQVRKYGSDLMQLVGAANQVPEHQLPPMVVKPGVPVSSKSLRELKKIVGQIAQEIGIAPELLAKRRHLEQLLRSVDEAGRYSLPRTLKGWREGAIGDALLKSLAG